MEISKEIEKNINKNLLQNKDTIISEMVNFFGKEQEEKIKSAFEKMIIAYVTKSDTIDELFSNKESLDDETISALDYYDDKIFNKEDMLNDNETIIGFFNLTGNLKENENIKLFLQNKDSIIYRMKGEMYLDTKLDIFDIHANEDYILELINLSTYDNNLNSKLSEKYDDDFIKQFINLRNIVGSVASKIIAESLSKKQIYLFSQNKDYNYFIGRTEILTYTFENDLSLILSDPMKFIEKIGIDNLKTFINNFKEVIEDNSMENIDKNEFKQSIDNIKKICHYEEQIVINAPLIKQTIDELKEKKEKLKTFPKFNKENPEITHIEPVEHKELPKLNTTSFIDIKKEKTKSHVKMEPFKLETFNDLINKKEKNTPNKTSFNDIVKKVSDNKQNTTFQDIVDQEGKGKSR